MPAADFQHIPYPTGHVTTSSWANKKLMVGFTLIFSKPPFFRFWPYLGIKHDVSTTIFSWSAPETHLSSHTEAAWATGDSCFIFFFLNRYPLWKLGFWKHPLKQPQKSPPYLHKTVREVILKGRRKTGFYSEWLCFIIYTKYTDSAASRHVPVLMTPGRNKELYRWSEMAFVHTSCMLVHTPIYLPMVLT